MWNVCLIRKITDWTPISAVDRMIVILIKFHQRSLAIEFRHPATGEHSMQDALPRIKKAPHRHLRRATMGAFAALALALPGFAFAQSANLAMIAEPQSLDPMASSADLVG